MDTLDRLSALLPEDAARVLATQRDHLTEVRLRAGRPVQLIWIGGEALAGGTLDEKALKSAVAALMDYSLYAREAELSRGFFTMRDGSRVGVCGRFAMDGSDWRLTDVGSACVRVARPIPGCADALMDAIDGQGGLRSALLLSAPGMGKTTLLRDIARRLSEAGRRVAIADERHEIAACHMGAPTLDVGPRTDVMDGCPRIVAIPALIRSMAPEVIVADEIGGPGDAEALADAARCGVRVVASAHAQSLEAALDRPALRDALTSGAFRVAALIGGQPGHVLKLYDMDAGGGMPRGNPHSPRAVRGALRGAVRTGAGGRRAAACRDPASAPRGHEAASRAHDEYV